MAITNLTAATGDDEIDGTVSKIVGSLTCDARSFEHAKLEYNSDFFMDETPEFTMALCRALHTFFLPVGTNHFWKKQGGV